ncbi:MAG TPA: hypothetical protein VFU37_21945 [Pyrinomonadaceae bacterium]|nr:hypothetical protein [Pyrinomonadaceae bacterium]
MSGYSLFEKWEKERSMLRVEFVGGHISATFTGHVVYQSGTELRLARLDDEISISLFFGKIDIFDAVGGAPNAVARFNQEYVCAARVITDAGASCMIYELRDPTTVA